MGDDCRAIGADIRLRCWELWRRNGEGQLWRPSWWPGDLSPTFWPLVLAAAVALMLAVWLSLMPRLLLPPSASEQAPPATQFELPAAPLEQEEPPIEQGLPEPELPPEPEVELPAESPEPPSEPVIDPLVELIQRPEADGLLLSAEALPEQGLLVLTLRPAFPALSPAEQERRAQQWQAWAADLGYEHLELRDSRSGLVARDALVGEGMIVLRDHS